MPAEGVKASLSHSLVLQKTDGGPEAGGPQRWQSWDQSQGLPRSAQHCFFSRAPGLGWGGGSVAGCCCCIPGFAYTGQETPQHPTRACLLEELHLQTHTGGLRPCGTWADRGAEERAASQTQGTPGARPINSDLWTPGSVQMTGKFHSLRSQAPSSGPHSNRPHRAGAGKKSGEKVKLGSLTSALGLKSDLLSLSFRITDYYVF